MIFQLNIIYKEASKKTFYTIFINFLHCFFCLYIAIILSNYYSFFFLKFKNDTSEPDSLSY